MVTMTYDYVRKLPAQVRALSLSERIQAKKQKLERYGGCSPDLEREIKNAESLLDDYLIEGAQNALESVKALQGTLDEYEHRKAAGYLTDDQIECVESMKSYMVTIIER